MLFQREARSGADLNLIAFGNCHRKTCADRLPRTGEKGHGFGSNDVHPRCTGGGVSGEGEVIAVGEAEDGD